jgi:hypothetical protein
MWVWVGLPFVGMGRLAMQCKGLRYAATRVQEAEVDSQKA